MSMLLHLLAVSLSSFACPGARAIGYVGDGVIVIEEAASEAAHAVFRHLDGSVVRSEVLPSRYVFCGINAYSRPLFEPNHPILEASQKGLRATLDGGPIEWRVVAGNWSMLCTEGSTTVFQGSRFRRHLASVGIYSQAAIDRSSGVVATVEAKASRVRIMFPASRGDRSLAINYKGLPVKWGYPYLSLCFADSKTLFGVLCIERAPRAATAIPVIARDPAANLTDYYVCRILLRTGEVQPMARLGQSSIADIFGPVKDWLAAIDAQTVAVLQEGNCWIVKAPQTPTRARRQSSGRTVRS